MSATPTLVIRTPENITFTYSVAGFGSRMLAAAIDYMLEIVILLVISLIFGLAMLIIGTSSEAVTRVLGPWAVALMMLGYFAVFEGYFIYFEQRWNGQTPGKRALRLRVIRDGGEPLTIWDSLVRNLLRLADILPFFYLTGAVSMLCTRHYRRLGDIAAGTVVVRETRETPPALPARDAGSPTVEITPEFASAVHRRLDEATLAVLLDLFMRRTTLTLERRHELMTEAAQLIRAAVPEAPFDITLSDEQLVELTLRAHGRSPSPTPSAPPPTPPGPEAPASPSPAS